MCSAGANGAFILKWGQPGNVRRGVSACSGFERLLRRHLDTLTHAYMRPRYAGYIHFQTQAGLIVHQFLRNGGNPDGVLEALNRLYLETFEPTLVLKGTGVR
jgi:multiple sugar transport system substrate-binding protein